MGNWEEVPGQARTAGRGTGEPGIGFKHERTCDDFELAGLYLRGLGLASHFSGPPPLIVRTFVDGHSLAGPIGISPASAATGSVAIPDYHLQHWH